MKLLERIIQYVTGRNSDQEVYIPPGTRSYKITGRPGPDPEYLQKYFGEEPWKSLYEDLTGQKIPDKPKADTAGAGEPDTDQAQADKPGAPVPSSSQYQG